jgi:hypothetical protein
VIKVRGSKCEVSGAIPLPDPNTPLPTKILTSSLVAATTNIFIQAKIKQLACFCFVYLHLIKL